VWAVFGPPHVPENGTHTRPITLGSRLVEDAAAGQTIVPERVTSATGPWDPNPNRHTLTDATAWAKSFALRAWKAHHVDFGWPPVLVSTGPSLVDQHVRLQI
jgi:hypothetical protein